MSAGCTGCWSQFDVTIKEQKEAKDLPDTGLTTVMLLLAPSPTALTQDAASAMLDGHLLLSVSKQGQSCS